MGLTAKMTIKNEYGWVWRLELNIFLHIKCEFPWASNPFPLQCCDNYAKKYVNNI